MRKGWALAIVLAVSVCADAAAAPLLPRDWARWTRTTDVVLNYRIPGHEDHFRIPFINDTGKAVTTTVRDGRTAWEYPKGTIILKEAYQGLSAPAPGEKPIRLYGMIKDPKNPKARGGWVWVVRDTATKTESIFESPLCIDCHSYANAPHPYGDKNPKGENRDFVFFPFVKK
jgi:hypothetical protein